MPAKKHQGPRATLGRPRERSPCSPFTAAVGERIRKRRLRQGLTQAEAAELTRGQVTLRMWSAYEVGRYDPRFSRVLAVAAALGCTPNDLLPPAPPG